MVITIRMSPGNNPQRSQFRQLQKEFKETPSFYMHCLSKDQKLILVVDISAGFHIRKGRRILKWKRHARICGKGRSGGSGKRGRNKGGWNKKYRQYGNVIDPAWGWVTCRFVIGISGTMAALVKCRWYGKAGAANRAERKDRLYFLFRILHFIVWRFNNNQWFQVATRF